MIGKKIALGTANFSISYGILRSKISKEANIKKILEFCQRNYIDTIDTSTDYNKAEEVIGGVGCENFNIVTKLAKFDKNKHISQSQLEKIILNSLLKLKKTSLYALLFRDPKSIVEFNYADLWKFSKNLKKKGIIKKLGISIYSPKELDYFFNVLKPDIVQAPYNFFDRRIEYSGWLNKLFQKNIEIHTRSSFLQGLLLKKKKELAINFLKYEKIWDSYYSWLTDNNVTALEACINFILKKKEISKMILGIENINQLNEIIQIKEKKINFSSWKTNVVEDLIDPRKW